MSTTISKIVQSGNEFKIVHKSKFGWRTEKEWLGIDNLGHDYGQIEKSFKTREEAEAYLSEGNYRVGIDPLSTNNSGSYPINIPRNKEKTSLSFKD